MTPVPRKDGPAESEQYLRTELASWESAYQKAEKGGYANDINHYLELYDIVIKKELIDPNLILNDVKERMQKKIEDSNAIINIASLPQFTADPVLFFKLMTNLIDNSIKYKKPTVDPVIDITYSLVAELNSVPNARKNTAYTIITITDNGIGFERCDSEKIFELFVQLDEGKHKGSGIGLPICKKIMEMHGGFINCEAEPEKGATFNCYFPA